MKIAAINKFTLLDYPGKTAAIVFTAGCNMRCGYCHNSQFVVPEKINELKGNFIAFEAVEKFLSTRQKFLEGVVFSGGEPTMYPDLSDCIKRVKKRGYLVKLDTNGTNPQMLKQLINEQLIDFVAMDLKSSFEGYSELTKITDTDTIEKSIQILLENKIDYEFRSTILPRYHSLERLHQMGFLIKGAKKWALQNFRNVSVLKEDFRHFQGFTPQKLAQFKIELASYVEEFEIRDN